MKVLEIFLRLLKPVAPFLLRHSAQIEGILAALMIIIITFSFILVMEWDD